MPRVSSDSTVTHRIELGIAERKKLDEIIETQRENQRLDAITNTLQAVGTAVGGGGALLAGLALTAWLAPSVIAKIKDKLNDWTMNAVAPLKDPIVKDIIERRKEEFYAKMKASLEREQELQARKTQFCTPSSKDFDSQVCEDLTIELEELLKARQAIQREATDIQTIIDEEIDSLEDLVGIYAPLQAPLAIWKWWRNDDNDTEGGGGGGGF